MADDTRIELTAVESAARTHAGRDPDKQVNEDASVHRFTRHGFLAVVCDGMGGHEGGREASHAAIDAVCDVLEGALSADDPRELLSRAIVEANARVFAIGGDAQRQGRPGSTLVAALVRPEGIYVAHVGDSRLYRVQNTAAFAVTKDHSAVQGLVDAGLLTPEEAAVHPDANRITRALGIAPEVQPDVRPTPLAYVAGDTFLLCSDGLSDLVKEPDILGIVQGAPLAQAAGTLVDLANARGGYDNITVVLFRTKASSASSSVGSATDIALPAVAATAVFGGSAPGATALVHPAAATTLASGPNGGPPAQDAAVAVAVERPRTQLIAPVAVPAGASRPDHSPRLPQAPRDEEDERPTRNTAAVVIGVICALLALAIGAFVVVHELGERGGKHTSAPPATSGPFVVPASASVAPASTPSPTAPAQSAVGQEPTPPELEPLRPAPNHRRGAGSATPETQGKTK